MSNPSMMAKGLLARRPVARSTAQGVQGDLFGAPAIPAAATPPVTATPSPAPTRTGFGALKARQMESGDDGEAPIIEAPLPTPAAPEEPGMTEIRGSVKRIIYTAGDFRVYMLKVKNENVSVQITSPVTAVENEKVVVKGEWGVFRGKPTFKGKLLIKELPTDSQGIVAWIKTGAVPGVGKLTGEKIAKHFGARSLEVISDPDILMECGLERKKAEAIATAWQTNAMQPELIAYLGSLGLGEITMTKIIRRYGMAAKKLIGENPWQLAETIEGIGFPTSDDIGKKAGHLPESANRIIAGLRYTLQEAVNRDGHCGLPREEMLRRAVKLLRLERPMVEAQVDVALDGEQYVFDEVTGLAAPRKIHHAETELVDHIQRLVAGGGINREVAEQAIDEAQRDLRITLDPSQRDAALLALTSPVSIITGGPGTGKSTTQKVIVRALKGFDRDVVLGAPTGRAAKRLAEVSGLDASTCHRLLAFNGELGGFTYHAENPFKEDWFIVDEFSMVDVRLANAFIQAVPDNAGLTIVGDVDQLPSVGAGQVLRDMIEAGVIPTARLTTVHRQGEDSGIITAAHRINTGRMPIEHAGETLNGFEVTTKRGSQVILEHVVDLMQNQLPAMGYDALKDVQVLAAMRRGDIGVEALNDAIKSALNPPKDDGQSVTIKFRTWTVGDRVMHTRNDYAKGVYNGEVGVVIWTGERTDDDGKTEAAFKVDYSGYEASYSARDIDDIEQCWAATVHKSQGCEFPVVVLVCPSDHSFMLNRNLFYTGVTRAKDRCIVVGDQSAVRSAVAKADVVRRHTGLAHHLALNVVPDLEFGMEAPGFIQMDHRA